VIVGSCLVLGSALGPAMSGLLVGPLGYRGLFAVLAGVGVVATAIVMAFVPETIVRRAEHVDSGALEPWATTSNLSTTP
jgi:MFS family permease